MKNAKNRLKEQLEGVGWRLEDTVVFRSEPASEGGWRTTVTVEIPGRPPATGCGLGRTARQADVAACEVLLSENAIVETDPEVLQLEAQAGDALIKLAAYRSAAHASAAAAADWLRRFESNLELAALFDRWQRDGRWELQYIGPGLGVTQKATFVEAILWRTYGSRVLGPDSATALAELALTCASTRERV